MRHLSARLPVQMVEEFMRGYFDERAELRKASVRSSAPFLDKFFTADYCAKHRSSQDEARSREKDKPASVLSVEVHDESAEVITSEPLGREHKRFRYHLQSSGGRWLIHRKEWECFLC